MQAVILAAGKSSRFLPFTNLTHKALTTIMGKTLLEHTLHAIKKSGIDDIILVCNPHSPLQDIFGDGSSLGIKLTYVIQQEALGMGDALLQAQEYIMGDFFLLNAYHVELEEFVQPMRGKKTSSDSIVLLGKQENIADRYGYILVNNEQVVGIVEKPKDTQSNALRLIGIYLLSKEFLTTLKNTPLEHYHFETALDTFAKMGKITVYQTERETLTLKYAWDLLDIKNYLLKNVSRYFSPKAEISEHAFIQGNVFIEEGAKIMEGVCIKGPCYIGKNTLIGNNAIIRNGVDIEEHAVAGAFMEVKNSLLMKGSTTHSGFIGDSLIGSYTKIGADFCSTNVRLDRKNIATEVKTNIVDSYRKHLGVIIGDNTIIGARVTTMPGIIIGNDTLIGPSTVIMDNIEDNVKFYTEFKNVVKKQNDKRTM